jgi:hypothetical protein
MSLKKIHRIYFGFDGKPDPYEDYLETWERQLPEYEILHWNSENLPIDICEYAKKMFELKDHAFLSDYFRWYLLNEFGGIYLDADIEIINGRVFNQLIEELEMDPNIDSFIGIDEKRGGWYTAHSMASKPKSEISSFMRSTYESFVTLYLWRRKDFYLMAPQLTALYFTSKGENVDGMGSTPNLIEPIIKSTTKIYPQDWFSPITPIVKDGIGTFGLSSLTDNTCLCHHFSGSWHNQDSIYAKSILSRGGRNLMLCDYLENQIRPAKRKMKIFKIIKILWVRRIEIRAKVKGLFK